MTRATAHLRDAARSLICLAGTVLSTACLVYPLISLKDAAGRRVQDVRFRPGSTVTLKPAVVFAWLVRLCSRFAGSAAEVRGPQRGAA